jgi:hypothetical protein
MVRGNVEDCPPVPPPAGWRFNFPADGEECFADITYRHTSLGPAGDEFVAKFTAEYYEKFMQVWEKLLNHFLRTGSCLPADSAA